MNWLGDFIQTQLEPDDAVLDLGCGIMQATLDTCPAYPPTKIQCKRLVGVDIHQPYLEILKERGVEVLQHDLTKLPLPFPDKSVDVVLFTDVLEHLKLYQAENLVQEGQRLARKKIICSTPKEFRRNEFSASFNFTNLGLNPYQRHQCLISKDWLKRFGFKTYNLHKLLWVGVRPAALKILHVWSQAGVSSLMTKYQRQLGHTVDLLTNYGFDGLEIDQFYQVQQVINQPSHNSSKFKQERYDPLPQTLKNLIRILNRKLRSAKFYWHVLRTSRDYDFIHIHSSSLSWFLTLFKPRIIEYHGSEIRKHPSKQKGVNISSYLMRLINRFTKLYYSTPDMIRDLPDKPEWIPNPIDKTHFSREQPSIIGTALYTTQYYEPVTRATQLAQKKGLHLVILDRKGKNWVSYKDFPRFMERFEYYIDRQAIPSLSKTGLEALALGLKVIDWKGDVLTGLPGIHEPEFVAERTLEIYYSNLYD